MKLPCMLAVAAAAALLAAPAAAQSYGRHDHCPERCCPDHCDRGPSGGGYTTYIPTRSTQTGYYSQSYSHSYSSRYSYSGRESYTGHSGYSGRESYGYATAPSYYTGGVGYRDDQAHRWSRGAVLPARYRSEWYVSDYGRYGYPSPPDDCGYYRTDSGQMVVARTGSGEILYMMSY